MKTDSPKLPRLKACSAHTQVDLVAVTINGVIGAGIFGLPAKVFALMVRTA